MGSNKGKNKVEENYDTHNNNNNGQSNRGNNYNTSSNSRLGPFPPGFKFEPTNEELIIYYLQPKVDNLELPPNNMHDIDLYDPLKCEEYNPEQLCENYEAQGEGEWYFFTSRDRKYPKGSRPNRASGGGYWKASGRDERIRSKIKQGVIGWKQTLVFYMGKPPSGKKTNWIMHEFRLDTDLTNSPQHDKDSKSLRIKLGDWVLCRIHYNTKGNKRGSGFRKEHKKPLKKVKCEPASTEIHTSVEANHATTTCGEVTRVPPQYAGCPPQVMMPRPQNVTDIPSTSHSIPVNNVMVAEGNYMPIWPQNVTDFPSTSHSTPENNNVMIAKSNYMPIWPQNVSYPTHDGIISGSANNVTDIPLSSNFIPEDVEFANGYFMSMLTQNLCYPIHNTQWCTEVTNVPSNSSSIPQDYVNFTDNNNVMMGPPQNMTYPANNTHWSGIQEDNQKLNQSNFENTVSTDILGTGPLPNNTHANFDGSDNCIGLGDVDDADTYDIGSLFGDSLVAFLDNYLTFDGDEDPSNFDFPPLPNLDNGRK